MDSSYDELMIFTPPTEETCCYSYCCYCYSFGCLQNLCPFLETVHHHTSSLSISTASNHPPETLQTFPVFIPDDLAISSISSILIPISSPFLGCKKAVGKLFQALHVVVAPSFFWLETHEVSGSVEPTSKQGRVVRRRKVR